MGWFAADAPGETSWLDNLNALTAGVSNAVVAADSAYEDVRNTFGSGDNGPTVANTPLRLNYAQNVAAQSAGKGMVSMQTLLNGTGPVGDLARYIQTPQGRVVALAVAVLAVYYIAKHRG